MNYITGVGSRKTPQNILNEMVLIGEWCKANNITIRSGHAEGADHSFEKGAGSKCIAYLPWNNFNSNLIQYGQLINYIPNPQTEGLARKYHPTYDNLKFGAQKMMGRNVWQVLGTLLNEPSKAIVCWTQNWKNPTGGTSQAIRIATDYGIPVINMNNPEFSAAKDVIKKLKNFLEV